ncbi:thioredoxin family protein [Celerinatantimonas sp. MCCC 1A17872]|uniref:thioredoxin family protein n=1 Tax=Celerinatantimonas sp. MCCC 1A17872 TaxID=3177514 RepID=UPI0038BF6EB4
MTQSIITLDDNSYQQNLKKDTTFVVRLWAPWCMPCRMMAPIFKEVAQKLSSDNLIFGEVDIDNFPLIANQLGVRSIPTVVVFKNGQEVTRSAGMMMAPQLEELIFSA